MKKLTKCDNDKCARYKEVRTVLGGCEQCGTQLIEHKPSPVHLAFFVKTILSQDPEDDGKISTAEIFHLLRSDPSMRSDALTLWTSFQLELIRRRENAEHA